MKKALYFYVMILLLLVQISLQAMNPNALISRNKTAYTSSGNVSYLTDNSFGGGASQFNVANNTWIAINLGNAHQQVFFIWNNPNYTWSDALSSVTNCKQSPGIPVNYTLQYSYNSTNGSNGNWTTVETVNGNNVTTRGHAVNLNGASWIKMSIASGSGSLDEVQVFDLGQQGNDLWFFPGTSITANTYKATVPAQNYADLIKQSFPAYTPAMIRGGIPCINSTQFKNDVTKYLAVAGNVKYWAIEMGTNDAWGGTNGGVSTFKNNMQAIITACKNMGIQPILSRTLATNANKAGWQVHGDYLKAIDDLTTQNGLISGPDLYSWFLAHPSELDATDGVHPNAAGAASIQKLWAEKMAPLYTATALSEKQELTGASIFPNPSNSLFEVHFAGIFEYTLQNEIGKSLEEGTAQDKVVLGGTCTSGIYYISIKQNDLRKVMKVVRY